jgi:hypothetical protein
MIIVHLLVLLVTVTDVIIRIVFRDFDLEAVAAGALVIVLLGWFLLSDTDNAKDGFELADYVLDGGLGIPALFVVEDDILRLEPLLQVVAETVKL